MWALYDDINQRILDSAPENIKNTEGWQKMNELNKIETIPTVDVAKIFFGDKPIEETRKQIKDFLTPIAQFNEGAIKTIGSAFGEIGNFVKNNIIEPIKNKATETKPKNETETQLEENATEDEIANADKIAGTNTSTEREQALEDQQRLWEREDAIRKETQEREDTAYQRAVADMIKAGINPNLMNVQPASAGAGIANASPVNYSTTTTELRNAMEQYLLKVKLSTEINENDKDRLLKYITAILGTLR